MIRQILCLNSGSSSIKFAVFEAAPITGLVRSHYGKIEESDAQPNLIIKDREGNVAVDRTWQKGLSIHDVPLTELLEMIQNELSDKEFAAVGHRVVHGGPRFDGPRLIDDDVLAELEQFSAFAPLHQPHNLAPIRALRVLSPSLPQVACFDTSFHQGRADIAQRFALPRRFYDEGIRRYGFHGLSYEYVAQELRRINPTLAQGRVIAAHLGNGASLCAMHGGRSIDTTMGFSTLDGLMMGTRCGALDPGVVLHLILHNGLSASQVERILYDQSGLLGVSGVSSDTRVLLNSTDLHAAEAIEMFCLRAAKEIAALSAALGGVDGIVFTAGIGEHQPIMRKRICAHLKWMGVVLDDAQNALDKPNIGANSSAIAVLVIPTNEERMIATHTGKLLWKMSL